MPQLWGKPFTSVWPEQKDLLTYYAGIFNGNGRNITINDNNNFMYVGRLELQLFKEVFGKGSCLKLGVDVLNSRDDTGHKYLAIVEFTGKRRRFAVAVCSARSR